MHKKLLKIQIISDYKVKSVRIKEAFCFTLKDKFEKQYDAIDGKNVLDFKFYEKEQGLICFCFNAIKLVAVWIFTSSDRKGFFTEYCIKHVVTQKLSWTIGKQKNYCFLMVHTGWHNYIEFTHTHTHTHTHTYHSHRQPVTESIKKRFYEINVGNILFLEIVKVILKNDQPTAQNKWFWFNNSKWHSTTIHQKTSMKKKSIYFFAKILVNTKLVYLTVARQIEFSHRCKRYLHACNKTQA